jgi:gliding motility-associated-like protein
LSVLLTEHDPFGDITRQYFYETPLNNTITSSLTHTYNQPGIYQIVQLISADVPNKTDTLTIEVFASTEPVFDYLYCDGNQIQVEIKDPTYDTYEVTFAGSSQVNLQDGETAVYAFAFGDPLSIRVKGLYTGAPDNCAESLLILPDIKAALVPPTPTLAQITQPCEDVYQLRISAAFDADVVYEIEWSKSGSSFQPLYEGLLTGPNTFDNIDFSSSETGYCVRINTRNPCDNTRNLGSQTCTTLQPDGLNPVRNVYSTYVGESISLLLDPTDQGTFLFQRSFDQVHFSNIHSGQMNYTDTSPFFGRQYFYRIYFQDGCNDQWNMQETQPPVIRAVELSPNTYTITFDPAVHSLPNNFSYEGQLTSSTGSQTVPITSNTFELKLPPILGEKQQFVIRGTNNDVTIQSNALSFTFEFTVHVPKAFTPNGDGLNDRLEIFGLGGANAQLNIYTRWGQQVYGEFSSAPSWDGRINGRLADEGVYIYEISVPDQPNHMQKGTFALIKK